MKRLALFCVFLFNTDLSYQRCSSNIATTECDDVSFSRGHPIKLDSYKKYLEFKHGGKIREIPKGSFRFVPEITTLSISFNTINTVEEGSFEGLINLEKLVLNHNNLKTINNGVFRDCQKLIFLDLGANEIKMIDEDAFAELIALEEIILAFNQLEAVPRSLVRLHRVKRVDLSNNKIKIIDSNIFASLTSLEVLELESNKIREVPGDAFRGLNHLKQINLKDNYLSNLNATNIINSLRSLKEIKLSINEFACKTLKSIVERFEAGNVKVAQGFSKSKVTVNGIACK